MHVVHASPLFLSFERQTMNNRKSMIFGLLLSLSTAVFVNANTFFVKNETCDTIDVKIYAKFECGWNWDRMHPRVKHIIVAPGETGESPELDFIKTDELRLSVRAAYQNKRFSKPWVSCGGCKNAQYDGGTVIVRKNTNGCYTFEWILCK